MQGSGEGDFLTAKDAEYGEGLLRLKEEGLSLKVFSSLGSSAL